MGIFTWGKIILVLLNLAESLMRIGQENKWIGIGEQRAIAAANAKQLRMNEYANQALSEFTAMPESQRDDFLRSLERPDGSGPVDGGK